MVGRPSRDEVHNAKTEPRIIKNHFQSPFTDGIVTVKLPQGVLIGHRYRCSLGHPRNVDVSESEAYNIVRRNRSHIETTLSGYLPGVCREEEVDCSGCYHDLFGNCVAGLGLLGSGLSLCSGTLAG